VQKLCDGRAEARIGLGDSELYHRVAAEFREMPGLRITAAQATRLFSMEAGRCMEVLETLVSDGVLATERGVFQAFGTGRRHA
jgi:hypothetical protein